MERFSNIKRVIFITDTHLGVRNNSNDWIDIHDDYFKNWFIPLCKKIYRPGDCLVHLGDVYDSRQSLNLRVLNLGIEIFEDLSAIFKDGIFIICGNHDIYGKNTNEVNSLKSLKWIPGIKIYEEPESIQLGNRKIFLMPWRKDHDAERETLMTVKEPHDYMFCHTDLKGLMFNKFVRIDAGLDYADMDKFERVYSGHIHYSQTFGKMRMLGSPFQLTRSDTDNAKGITVLDLESGDEEYYENNYSPKFVRITFDKVLNSTPNELNHIFKNNFIDIMIDPIMSLKAPLSILTDSIQSQRSVNFHPYDPNQANNLTQQILDTEGRIFNVMDFIDEYVKGMDTDDLTKGRILSSLQKLHNLVAEQDQNPIR